MRNYLFDQRPPTGGPLRKVRLPGGDDLLDDDFDADEWIPVRGGTAYTATRMGRRRRKRSPLPWIIAFAAAILTLVAAALLIQHYAPDWASLAPEEGGGFYDYFDDVYPSFWMEESNSGEEPTMARAPVGDGTVLTLWEAPEEWLTANEIYEKALPSVVSIMAYMEMGSSSGSGVIMSADGYIITNYHVIEGASSATVTTLDTYESYEATLVGYAAELDLAVLKVEARGLTAAEFGSSRALSVGDGAYALGNPMGYLYGTFTEGIISALAQRVTVGGYQMSLIQTSAPLNSGNSGGALLNEYGQVVGITSAKVSSSTDVVAEGLGLAIPISDIRGCINSIIAYGRVVTPRIGITCYSVRADGVDGILVQTVDEDGPALTAGLRPMDFITAANGVPVGTVEELKDLFYDVGVGGTVELTVQREGETLTLPMTLAGDTP